MQFSPELFLPLSPFLSLIVHVCLSHCRSRDGPQTTGHEQRQPKALVPCPGTRPALLTEQVCRVVEEALCEV